MCGLLGPGMRRTELPVPGDELLRVLRIRLRGLSRQQLRDMHRQRLWQHTDALLGPTVQFLRWLGL